MSIVGRSAHPGVLVLPPAAWRRRWQHRRFRLAFALALLSAALVAVVLGSVYLLVGARQEAAALPTLRAIAAEREPRFLFAINGPVQPLGVAVSPDGQRIYVTESGGSREVRVYDRDGNSAGTLGPPGTTDTSRAPVYVAVGPDGRVYVSDRQASAVFVYGPDGSFAGRLNPPDGADAGWQPLGLGIDGAGRLLVTNVAPGRHEVVVFGPDGRFLRRFGRQGSGPDEFQFPNGVAVDRQGRTVVSDSNNGRVVFFAPDDEPLWTIGRGGTGGGLLLPRGIAVDGQDRLYVVDTLGQRVQVYRLSNAAPRLLFSFGGEGVKDGQFNFPNGLAVDPSGRLYVTDRENSRVQVWTY